MMWRSAWMALVLALASVVPPARRGLVWALGGAALHPMVTIVAVVALAARGRLRAHRMQKESVRRARRELPLLGDLVSLGLTAGASFPASLEAAVPHLESGLGDEVAGVLRRGRLHGTAVVLEAHEGVAGRLYRLAGRAITTGAPLATAVEAFTDEARAADRAERLAAARRLPVLLMFPLALLILPGFVLLTVAPAVVGAIERLGP